ncbi:MAG TPA: arylamine N-acetyltransferase [Ktedonobacterales bacterium]
MTDHNRALSDYVHTLGLSSDTQLVADAGDPSGQRLAALVRRHLRTVPYENVSKWLWHGRGHGATKGSSPFDLATYVADLRDHGLGGTCFTLALGCHALLRGLGYDASLVLAPEENHAAVLVATAQGSRLVDVGFFAPFWEPPPLDRPSEWVGALGTFRVLPEDGAVALHRPSGLVRRLAFAPVAPEVVWRAWVRSATPGHPLFPEAVILQRLSPEAAWSMRDLSLRIVDGEGVRDQTLTPTDARLAVRGIFGVDPGVWHEAYAYRMGRPAED